MFRYVSRPFGNEEKAPRVGVRYVSWVAIPEEEQTRMGSPRVKPLQIPNLSHGQKSRQVKDCTRHQLYPIQCDESFWPPYKEEECFRWEESERKRAERGNEKLERNLEEMERKWEREREREDKEKAEMEKKRAKERKKKREGKRERERERERERRREPWSKYGLYRRGYLNSLMPIDNIFGAFGS
ncbi:hypothetical protein N431DRAFT_448581 [Stipitochalara longipes BDJ]|nr:hypothetical protein N431DRAFT_448581 [Stipitochalara longipes BDJ]